jgi:hypothetical protein
MTPVGYYKHDYMGNIIALYYNSTHMHCPCFHEATQESCHKSPLFHTDIKAPFQWLMVSQPQPIANPASTVSVDRDRAVARLQSTVPPRLSQLLCQAAAAAAAAAQARQNRGFAAAVQTMRLCVAPRWAVCIGLYTCTAHQPLVLQFSHPGSTHPFPRIFCYPGRPLSTTVVWDCVQGSETTLTPQGRQAGKNGPL